MVLGYTSVVDLSASDRVTIGGSFILAENSINVLGADLDLQPLKQGNIRFMAGLMTLDTEGNLEVFGNARFAKDVEVRGKLSANLIAPVPRILILSFSYQEVIKTIRNQSLIMLI